MCRFAIFAVFTTIVVAHPQVGEKRFNEFIQKFGKRYTDSERARRFEIFVANLLAIEKTAADDESARYSHLTPFADLTAEEFAAFNGFTPAFSDITFSQPAPLLDTASTPESWDWVAKGAVNRVKNQGQCGSCWAFATVANIEGVNFVSGTKTLFSLSEQELVDCDTKSGDQGCQGGLPQNAYKAMIKNKLGLELESDYPYEARGATCHADPAKEKVFITSWTTISTDENQIAAALVSNGPLAIGINASPMQFYTGGVADPKNCDPKGLDHGVAIVGFGVDDGKPYWKIRNSWGDSWGEDGYYRIVRGQGKCGLNTAVTTALGPYAPSVDVEQPGEQRFEQFIKKFEKEYGSPEERARRFQIFVANLLEIEQAMADDEGANYSHLTPFADLTKVEFGSLNGFRSDLFQMSDSQVAPLLDISSMPISLDWVAKGAVNPVKNQKQCGSCWAFATVANIEGVNFVSGSRELLSLSEQELVDCDTKTGDQGCQGGLPSNAYKDLIKSKLGLELESDYPYMARNGKCHAAHSKEKVFISSWKTISTDEDQIAVALAQYGPLAIGINAGPMQFYNGGVANPKSCNPKSLDHGVAIVGYGVDSGKKYWKIRNSWGDSWGEHGYYRIVRGQGKCGLNTMVTTAIMGSAPTVTITV